MNNFKMPLLIERRRKNNKKAKAIGIIGGSDGPTIILVSKKSKINLKAFFCVAMIFIFAFSIKSILKIIS